MVLAVPAPVYAAYLIVLLALIFVRGMSEVVQGGLDHRKALIAGLGFWVGVGCQNGVLFPSTSRTSRAACWATGSRWAVW